MGVFDFITKPFRPGDNAVQSEEDLLFSNWYAEKAEKSGINPNPNAPRHYYDYRAAYEAGVEPAYNEELKKWKWPSEFKHDLHPDRYTVSEKDSSVWDTKYDIPAKFEDMIIQSMQRKEYEDQLPLE